MVAESMHLLRIRIGMASVATFHLRLPGRTGFNTCEGSRVPALPMSNRNLLSE